MDEETEASRGGSLPGLTQWWPVWRTALCHVLTWGNFPPPFPSLNPISRVQKRGSRVDSTAAPSRGGGRAGWQRAWGRLGSGSPDLRADRVGSPPTRSLSQSLTLTASYDLASPLWASVSSLTGGVWGLKMPVAYLAQVDSHQPPAIAVISWAVTGACL